MDISLELIDSDFLHTNVFSRKGMCRSDCVYSISACESAYCFTVCHVFCFVFCFFQDFMGPSCIYTILNLFSLHDTMDIWGVGVTNRKEQNPVSCEETFFLGFMYT